MNQNINLIDAHSFCWIIGYKDGYQEWLKDKANPESQTIYNAFEISPINNSSNQRRSTPNEANRDGTIDWDKENKRKRGERRRTKKNEERKKEKRRDERKEKRKKKKVPPLGIEQDLGIAPVRRPDKVVS